MLLVLRLMLSSIFVCIQRLRLLITMLIITKPFLYLMLNSAALMSAGRKLVLSQAQSCTSW